MPQGPAPPALPAGRADPIPAPIATEGPSRSFVYRTTLIQPFGYGNEPRAPTARRTTWALDVGASWATLRRVRESSDEGEQDGSSARFDTIPWRLVDEARYDGRCVATGSESCLSASSVRLDFARRAGPSSIARSLAWECTKADVEALPPHAVHRMGDCEFTSTSWVPAQKRKIETMRCDGAEAPEPSDESFEAARDFRNTHVPSGLVFAPGRGVEWAFINFDCPLPGALRQMR